MKIAERYTRQMLECRVIEKSAEDIYNYGLECLVLKIIHYISYFCIAMVLGMPLELLVMGCTLLGLRKGAGGYHAKTRIGCYIFSCITVLLGLIICKYVTTITVFVVFLIIADIIIVWLAPVENENKILDKTEVKFFRKYVLIVLGIENILCITLLALGLTSYFSIVVLGISIVASLLLIAKCLKRRTPHELF